MIRGLKRTLDTATARNYAIATTCTAFNHMLSINDSSCGKDIMKSFLHAFVPAFDRDPIASIQSYPISIPAIRDSGRDQKFMDVHVATQNNEHYIIEMQAKREIMYNKRAIFYPCATYANQLTKSQREEEDWYHDLKHVIAIQVLDYNINRAQRIEPIALIDKLKENQLLNDQYIKHYAFTDRYSQKTINTLEMIQINLPLAKPVLEKKKINNHSKLSDTEWWVELFCYSSEYTDEQLESLKSGGVIVPHFFEKALKRLDMDNWGPQLKQDYAADIFDQVGYATVLTSERQNRYKEAYEEAYKEAFAEGRKEGIMEVRKSFALRMLSKNKSDDFILKFSKLTPQELAALKASTA